METAFMDAEISARHIEVYTKEIEQWVETHKDTLFARKVFPTRTASDGEIDIVTNYERIEVMPESMSVVSLANDQATVNFTLHAYLKGGQSRHVITKAAKLVKTENGWKSNKTWNPPR